MTTHIRKVYEPFDRTDGISFEGTETMTKQSFQEEVDINNIVARYHKTGLLGDMIKENPQYGDFSEAPDYKEALEIVHRAKEQFEALSAEVRERFQNDPEKFLAFTHDPNNLEEMGNLKLLTDEARDRIMRDAETRRNADIDKEIAARTAASKPPSGTPSS